MDWSWISTAGRRTSKHFVAREAAYDAALADASRSRPRRRAAPSEGGTATARSPPSRQPPRTWRTQRRRPQQASKAGSTRSRSTSTKRSSSRSARRGRRNSRQRPYFFFGSTTTRVLRPAVVPGESVAIDPDPEIAERQRQPATTHAAASRFRTSLQSVRSRHRARLSVATPSCPPSGHGASRTSQRTRRPRQQQRALIHDTRAHRHART